MKSTAKEVEKINRSEFNERADTWAATLRDLNYDDAM